MNKVVEGLEQGTAVGSWTVGQLDSWTVDHLMTT
jgi:hypothetical protein